MFLPDDYELIDFGAGRKLERFGSVLVDRLSPASENDVPRHPQRWKQAEAKFVRSGKQVGRWEIRHPLPADWTISHEQIRFELKLSQFGQVGVFPEQASNWDWVSRQVSRGRSQMRVLNLFAYTGGSSLAAAAAGADVVHVDAASNVVKWARRNAQLSSLGKAPIRWIAEDARKFVLRERKRGNQYDAIILDPPTYGHGPKGQVWQIDRHLLPLLQACADLTAGRRDFFLLTCHSPGFGPAELEALLADTIFGSCQAGARGDWLQIHAEDQRKLASGVVARWPA